MAKLPIRIFTLVLVSNLALFGCAASSGEGTTTDWGANSFVNAAELEKGVWMITCTNAASACTKRARAICPDDYDLISMENNPQLVGYELVVKCRNAE